jgi:putative Holliday junction resolvase
MRWLAVDVGARRMGLATCDEDESVCTPLETRGYLGPRRSAVLLAERAAQLGVGGIVVGRPVTRTGAARGELRVEALLEELRRATALVVETVDESGSTWEAERRLSDAGLRRSRLREVVDRVAAVVILETHIARRRPTSHVSTVDLPQGGC